ncbi:hypothetical protein ALC56_12266 [Trachymyrmex septentrionalis]|uniref:Transmembrane protein n=1 Tax=Trachymyrmex septentrionalis TaxID=34720 RepID=A0A195F0A7_9HYME|nr:hypothetical protein ALC56_12266 [Trachymyrmex septentrionalis]
MRLSISLSLPPSSISVLLPEYAALRVSSIVLSIPLLFPLKNDFLFGTTDIQLPKTTLLVSRESTKKVREKKKRKDRSGNGRENKKREKKTETACRRVPLRRSYFLFFFFSLFDSHSVSPVDRSLGRWLATSFNEGLSFFLFVSLSLSLSLFILPRVLFRTRPLSVYSLPR